MRSPSLRIAAHGAFALAMSAYGALAHARQPNDRGWLSVAGFRPTIESTARSDFLPGNRPGTEVRFEDDLGLSERKTLPWFLAGVRTAERWRIQLECFSLRRSGTRTLSRDIAWGDSVHPASAKLSSEFDSDVLRLSAGYSFVRSSSIEIGGVLGLHTTRFRLALASQVSVGNATGSGQAEAEEATVPLPTVGLYGTHRLDGDWGWPVGSTASASARATTRAGW